MPITIITGRAGQGKSIKLADEMLQVIDRNLRWFKKTGLFRPIYSNLELSNEIFASVGGRVRAIKVEWEKKLLAPVDIGTGMLRYWVDPTDLVQQRDCDVFIDEAAVYFDANDYKELGREVKRWLQQHRKIGIEIWATAQDFAQVDVAFRRLTDKVVYMVKLIGSRDPSPTKPPVNFIWGISIERTINPTDYDENDKTSQATGFWPFFITARKTRVFDTRQEIREGEMPPLRHRVRRCMTCGEVRVTHV